MTLAQYLYLKSFEQAYFDYSYDLINKRKYVVDQDRFQSEVKLALAFAHLEMILLYYRDTVTGDENCFTVVEIKDIIDNFNNIVGSEIAYETF